MAKRKSINDIWVLILVLVCILLIGMELVENVASELDKRNSSSAYTEDVVLVHDLPAKSGRLM